MPWDLEELMQENPELETLSLRHAYSWDLQSTEFQEIEVN